MSKGRKIRVLMVKVGLDGHWRGAISVSFLLKDAGMEVIFGGFQVIESIINTAIQEDVDAIGLSIHSGAHIDWTQKMVKRLEERGLRDKFVLMVGGAIPEYDFEELKKMGAYEVFSPGTLPGKIINAFRESVAKRKDI
jgi:methylmalonyl-CoA mutase C-terminal domain/subunit